MSENVRYDTQGAIATITLNRPERLNALSPAMQEEIVAAVGEAERDDAVRVAIIQGAGRAFSAGYDISAGGDASGVRDVTADRDRLEEVLRRWLQIWDARIPVIAKVHGYCLAGGTQLATICDVTIAAEDTRVGSAQLPLGAGFVATFWAWWIGPKKAKELLLPTGELISGAEAAAIGLFNRAVPADDLDEIVSAYAARMARTPKDLLALQKQAINRTQDAQGFREALFQGAEVDAIAHTAPSVLKMKQRIAEHGLKAALAEWRGDP